MPESLSEHAIKFFWHHDSLPEHNSWVVTLTAGLEDGTSSSRGSMASDEHEQSAQDEDAARTNSDNGTETYLDDLYSTADMSRYWRDILVPPGLHRLLLLLEMSDMLQSHSAYAFAIRAVPLSPEFSLLSPAEQLQLACRAGVAQWVRPPFLTLVRSNLIQSLHEPLETGMFQDLGPNPLRLLLQITRTRNELLYNQYRRTLRGAPVCPGVGSGSCERQSKWPIILNPVCRFFGYPVTIRNCKFELRKIWNHIISRGIQRGFIDSRYDFYGLEHRLRIAARKILCSTCYSFVEAKWRTGFLTVQQRDIEERRLLQARVLLGFAHTRHTC